MKRNTLLLLLCSTFICLSAQDTLSVTKSSPETTKLIRLDIGPGCNIDLTHRSEGDLISRLSERKKVIPSIDLRFAYFLIPKWGVYSNLNIRIPGTGSKKIFPEICQQLETDYFVRDIYSNYDQLSQANIFWSIGPAYRVERKNWGFFSYVGLGVNTVAIQSSTLLLKQKDSNNLYEINIPESSGYYEEPEITIGVEFGLNAFYKLNNHLHLFMNVSYYQPCTETTKEYTVTDLYTNEMIRNQTSTSTTLGRSLQLSLGIGFPFYINKRKPKQYSPRKERMRTLMEKKRKDYGLFPGNQ